MKTRQRWCSRIPGWIAAAGVGFTLTAAAAQEGVPPPPANENPQGQNRDAERERWRNMTPEERRAQMEQFIAQRLRQRGFSDQDIAALKQYNSEREEAQKSLGEVFRSLSQTAKTPESTEDQARIAIAGYKEAMKTHEATLENSRKKLDESIHYSTRPKIEAILLTMGVLDNGMGLGMGMGMRRGDGMGDEANKPLRGEGQRGGQRQGQGGQPPAEPPKAPMN
ncbi:MAG: hypothetical protein AUJ92_14125 [Armatimonadetes bacterium CG2_30_59_28]|nr:DUF1289 domain-containing protein [Armatimonadota bacterium]OIO92430.1 MAG: hypothetical protein AUJ92_14125 [Armatimonadetes bacterium CG2_30_59_28]PIU60428.1 MAG: hypothetical protein COS85_24555 [Armatimonadetes bacterium CG07_land_8_20_14_0_80_59_28]PIX45461.1 MAG: hypothetical protein COZ56_01830 [Armatimonadetes bacterium CG_4_8_14_3_um_filter_58_9]PIY49231.1 MAG: hypothetical protein COZ05_00870 [Armatimonadetes bacterium CG_4_10_14_3_um_filter_59_10]PJB63505.1 MAG: hypothetical prot